jgi:hypothetical protein
MIMGGQSVNVTQASAEVYDPVAKSWSPVAPMNVMRWDLEATLLVSGRVLVTGGRDQNDDYLNSAEIYDPATNTWTLVGSMSVPRSEHTSTLLQSGGVLLTGGRSTSIQNSMTGEFYELDDGGACTTNAQCLSGFCVDGVCCDSACNSGPCEACSVAAGAAQDGTCTGLTGPACDDGNACSMTDTCQAGACVGADPVQCAPLDSCHSAGVCNPQTGMCSSPAKPDGASCDDGNACTKDDACQAFMCVSSGSAVMCAPQDECHDAGTYVGRTDAASALGQEPRFQQLLA